MKIHSPAPIVLLTGLSGAGKTSIGRGVQERLNTLRLRSTLLDGDELRRTLCRDLGFTPEDRREHFIRVTRIAELLSSQRRIVLVALISPFRDQRDELKTALPHVREVYVAAPLRVCKARDTKGLYAASCAGTLSFLTGIDSPYEEPLAPDLICHTDLESLPQSINKVLRLLGLTVID